MALSKEASAKGFKIGIMGVGNVTYVLAFYHFVQFSSLLAF